MMIGPQLRDLDRQLRNLRLEVGCIWLMLLILAAGLIVLAIR